MDVLAWVARVGVATIEPVGRALGLSVPTTYSHVQRLERVGWLERMPTQVGAPSLLIVTRAGLRALGQDTSSLRPRPPGWAHDVAIAEVASWLATHPKVRWWRHEREFAGDPRSAAWYGEYSVAGGRSSSRRPDLVADFGGTVRAIEVELTVKSTARRNAIVAGWIDAVVLGRRVDGVVYIVGNDQVDNAIGRAIAAASRTRPQARSVIKLAAYEKVAAIQRTAPAGSIGAGGAADVEQRTAPLLGLAA